MPEPVDEFDWISSLRGLTRGDPAALDLRDDAAVIPSRPGFDLVVSEDAMVEGVHFLVGEAPEIIARRLLRASLSDLAAKAATPFGYFMMAAWPPGRDDAWREQFRAGLASDGETFGISLLGGDTVSTPGPLTLNASVLGWVRAGKAVLRSGARAGDVLVICGPIGDAWLGLKALGGEVTDPVGALAARHRLPEPLLRLQKPLLAHAQACADVSDGLLADAGHIAEASGLGLELELSKIPMSPAARRWLGSQSNEIRARLDLATGGDDYALACAVAPEDVERFGSLVEDFGVPAQAVGRFVSAAGLTITAHGAPVEVGRTGWRHAN